MLRHGLRHGLRLGVVARRLSGPLGAVGAANLGGSDTESSRVQITEFDAGGFELGGDMYIPSSIVVLSRSAYLWRPQTYDDVTMESLRVFTVVHPRPEIVILGLGESTGPHLDDVVFTMRDLGIAIEQMDTSNAVHTFNILNDENRTVGAAILTLRPRGDDASDPFLVAFPSP